jgi:hypothetical protein
MFEVIVGLSGIVGSVAAVVHLYLYARFERRPGSDHSESNNK